MPKFLKRAGEMAPDAEFELETGLSEALEAKVGTGILDAAVITASENPPAGIFYSVLAEEPLRFAVPSQFSATPVSELARNLPFLQFTPSSGIGKVIARNVAALIGESRKQFVIDSVEAIMECVNEGLGFTLLSETDISRYADHRTATLGPPRTEISRQLVLAARQDVSSKPDINRLLGLFSMG